MDLLVDENFPRKDARALQSMGHDVISVQYVGLSGATDLVVLAHAYQTGRAVVTADLGDYETLHQRDKSHSGIVLHLYDRDSIALAERIDAALTDASATGRFIVLVDRTSHTFLT